MKTRSPALDDDLALAGVMADCEVTVILPAEAEFFVQAIEAVALKDIGGPK